MIRYTAEHMAKTSRQVTVAKPRFATALPYVLIIGGAIGILCSFILVHDQIKIWENPNYSPACSLNPTVSCGTVIHSQQGDIFGIPAPFFGLLTFPVFVTVGVMLLAGAQLRRWFWQLFEVGAVASVVFALWLFYLSMYRIHALCPFCLTVDVAVYTLAWYITLYTVGAGHVTLPDGAKRIVSFALRHHAEILCTWLLLLIALILQHFWYYYGQFL